MKDLRIDGRWQRVFVLRQSADRLAYIPIKTLHRVDYERLVKAEQDCPRTIDLMEYLRKVKFDNGRAALLQLDNLVQVADIKGEAIASRLKKSDELSIDKVQELLERQVMQAKIAQLESNQAPANANVSVSKVATPAPAAKQSATTDDPQYKYIHHRTNKPKIWSGKGPMPTAIAEAIKKGKTLEDFLV